MSCSLLAVLVTAPILIVLTRWVPCVHLCHRFVGQVIRRDLTVIVIAVGCVLTQHSMAFGQLVVANTITTVAGNGNQSFSGDGGQATAASVGLLYQTAVDSQGNLYIADINSQRIRKVTAATGIITTIAGTGAQGYSGDGGQATNATFYFPEGIAVDTAGNLYISDTYNHVIRKITAATGVVTTIAGTGSSGYSGDGGPATSATFYFPQSLAVDAAGNIYIPDYADSVVRKIAASTGVISTVAGTGVGGYSGDGGAATAAQLYAPFAVCLDAAGNLYIGDTSASTVRKVAAATGTITTVAGSHAYGDTGDGGPATAATISAPYGIAVDGSGNLYIADTGNEVIRRVDAVSGIITRYAGNGSTGFSGDGSSAPGASFDVPQGLTIDSKGFIYVMDAYNYRVRKVAPFAIPATAVGSTSAPQNLLLQTTAAETISGPFVVPASLNGKQEYSVGTVTGCVTDGVTSNPVGTVCSVPITFSPAYPGLRPEPIQVTTSAGKVAIGLDGLGLGPLASLTPGIISTVAGNGVRGFSGTGGPATNAAIEVGLFITVDTAGNLYFLDGSSIVMKITAATGIIAPIAGSGPCEYGGDGGPALSADICEVFQIAIDPAGNLFLAENYDSVIRRVDAATGIITTFAGNTTQTETGDGGPATSAGLYAPRGVAFDNEGNLYISTLHVVRKVAVGTGIITTVVGNGTPGNSGDGGQAINAMLNNPSGLSIDSADNLYIADQLAGVVRKVSLSSGIISTVAGNGTKGSTGDGGSATSAELNDPVQIAVNSAGDLYIVDDVNLTVRKVEAATGIISTVAGYGPSFSGLPAKQDGIPAPKAYLNKPTGVAVDGAGSVYIGSDIYIRKVDVSTSALIYPTTTNVGSADSTDDPQSFTVSNAGNTNLNVPLNSATADPAISSAWSVDVNSNCPNLSATAYNLIPGKDCTFAVDFTPTVPGTNSGSLVLTDNSLNVATAAQTVTLSGTGSGTATVAAISLSPTTVAFPDTQVGGTSSQMITVSSSGTATATITGITISGAGMSSFSRTTGCGKTLASGSTCSITVTFSPTAANQTFSATVSVASDDPNSPATAALSGKGLTAGTLSISPTTQTFPSTKVGSTSTVQTSTISNTTAQAIYLSSGSLTDATDFTQSDNCNGLLASGGSCTVSFTFTPQSVAPLSSTYAIHNLNNPGSPLMVALSGPGASAGVGAITLTPSAVNFTTTVGVTAGLQSVTLTNSGTAQVTFGTSPISVSGTNASSFQASAGGCGYTLAVGASCNATVSLLTTTAGTYTAAFTATYFTIGTTTATASVPLTGTVTASSTPADFTLQATPASQSSYRGRNVSYTLQLTSLLATNAFTNAATMSVTGLPAGATASFAPASVVPGVSSPASTVMTISILALVGEAKPKAWHGSTPLNVSLATLLVGLFLPRSKRRKIGRLLSLVVLAAIAGSFVGCGTGSGFEVSTSTSNITVTATSGTTVHSTTVTLTIQ